MRVLDQNASVRAILPSQVTNKIETRRAAVATDRNGSEIRVGDSIRETSGEMRTGTILHIHRSFLFCNNRTQIDNSGKLAVAPIYMIFLTYLGIFVTRCVNVVTLAAKGARVTSNGPDLSKMNPALHMKNGINSNDSMAPPKSIGRDRTLGKTVTIRKGPYKGMLGIVKDATDTTARVELHSKSRVVNIDKDALAIKEYVPELSHLEWRFVLTI
jgi:transcription elongation factor SPT5